MYPGKSLREEGLNNADGDIGGAPLTVCGRELEE